MDYKQSVLAKRYVGEIFKYALSQNIDIYIFILEFLKSHLKRKIEAGLVDVENLDFEYNDELNNILLQIPKSKNKEYKKMMPYEFYDFSDIIYWTGETLQNWYSELYKNGKIISNEFSMKNFENMINRFSYLYNENSIYIYNEVYDLSSNEILTLKKSLELDALNK